VRDRLFRHDVNLLLLMSLPPRNGLFSFNLNFFEDQVQYPTPVSDICSNGASKPFDGLYGHPGSGNARHSISVSCAYGEVKGTDDSLLTD